MDFIKKIFLQHKAVILYLFFGGCTTITNIAAYAGCSRLLCLGTMTSTVISWCLAVLFAYLTIRKWVFGSTAAGARAVFLEAFAFFSCRLTTGLADIGMMWLFVVYLGCNDILIKIIANITVIVMNYIASKCIIFRK